MKLNFCLNIQKNSTARFMRWDRASKIHGKMNGTSDKNLVFRFVYITATPAADHWPACYPLFAIQKISHLHDRSDSTTQTPWTGVTGWRWSLPRWAAVTTSSTPSCRSTCQTTPWEPALTCSTSRSERCWEFILHFWTQTDLFGMHGIAETCSLTRKILVWPQSC